MIVLTMISGNTTNSRLTLFESRVSRIFESSVGELRAETDSEHWNRDIRPRKNLRESGGGNSSETVFQQPRYVF